MSGSYRIYDHITDVRVVQVVDSFGGTDALDGSRNHLSYPASQYDNLKADFSC